jgi:hypothetical protein
LIRSEGPRSLQSRWKDLTMAKILVKPNDGWGVERAVTSSFLRMRSGFRCLPSSFVGLVFASALCAEPIPEIPPPFFGQFTPPATVAPGATSKAAAPLDELEYQDGDRVRGHFLQRDGDVLVFKSERFGILRVPAAMAKLTLAKPSSPAVAEAAKKAKKADVAVERSPFSPVGMAEALKEFFGSWHGRFAMSAEMMKDSVEHDSGTVEAHLQRKMKKDEVQLTARYDYATVDDQTTSSTDIIKGAGVWRHDFPNKLFSVYRPTLEWNRAFFRLGVPADYVLLQQEVGAGINLFNSETRKIRVGLSENLFDTWVTPTQSHVSQTDESAFVEVEAKLPWRIVVTDRGVWYYSIADQSQGWENRFEINKKLTETLTMGLRQETRHNNPDVRSADYRRLRVLFGFDF